MYIRTMYICIISFISAPSSVRNLELAIIDDTIVITWLPPITPYYGIILQYIIQRITSSGKSYYYVSGTQNSFVLPYSDNALVFVAAVNLYGQSNFELARSNGMKYCI